MPTNHQYYARITILLSVCGSVEDGAIASAQESGIRLLGNADEFLEFDIRVDRAVRIPTSILTSAEPAVVVSALCNGTATFPGLSTKPAAMRYGLTSPARRGKNGGGFSFHR